MILTLIKRMILCKNRMQVSRKLMTLGFLSLNFVRSVGNNFQLILISFVDSVGRKDIFEPFFIYKKIKSLFY